MTEPSKETRARMRQAHMNEMTALRRSLEEILEFECVSLGGHFWWPERKIQRDMVARVEEAVERMCKCCRKKETLSTKTLYEKF